MTLAPDQVVALAERVSESEGIENGDDNANTDEVMGLVHWQRNDYRGGGRQQFAAALPPGGICSRPASSPVNL